MHFLVTDKQISILDKKRKKGISGHMRIRNGDFLIDECIKSCLSFLDELIITYNDCDDNTEKILKKYLKNKKIKIYSYDHKLVFDINKKIEKNHLKTFSNYYNYGLIKISYEWYMKIDVDQWYNTNEMLLLRDQILNTSNDNDCYLLCGVNLFFYKDNICLYHGSRFNGKYFSPINGGWDHFVIKPNSKNFYINYHEDKFSIEKFVFYNQNFIYINVPMWIHWGTYKYNDLLGEYLNKKRKINRYITPVSLCKKENLLNSLFFSKKILSCIPLIPIFRLVYKKIEDKYSSKLNYNNIHKLKFYYNNIKNMDKIASLLDYAGNFTFFAYKRWERYF